MQADKIARLRVTMEGIRPPIWRRLEVPIEFTFAQLSGVILAAFGWSNYHLHEFEVGRRRIGMPDEDDWQAPVLSPEMLPAGVKIDPKLADLFSSPPLEDEATVRLASVLESGVGRFVYRYDFGDDWQHLVRVEGLLPAQGDVTYPRCTAGRRSAPPEDCGGLPGYEHLLEVLADPAHGEYAELREWTPDFEPEEFDLAAADRAVKDPRGFWDQLEE